MAFFEKTKLEYDQDGTSKTVTSTDALPVQDSGGASSTMGRLLQILMNPMGYDRSLGRSRVTAVVESGTVTTVTTVTTVSTVTAVTTVAGLTNIDSRPGSMLINSTNLVAWHDCVRSRIT